MFEELQDAYNLLDWLQIELMMWERRERNKEKRGRLQQYKRVVQRVMDFIEDFDSSFDCDEEEE